MKARSLRRHEKGMTNNKMNISLNGMQMMPNFIYNNGRVYQAPDKDCSSCAHCSDVFYGYYYGQYLFICNIGDKYTGGCDLYK